MSSKYALIIANTEYIDPGLAQLRAPGKDAEDFARVLQDPNIAAFDDVKVLLNQLSSTIGEAIDEFFDQKKPDDLLILYFSGHGIRDEVGSLFLAAKNTIRSRLRSTAVKSDYIREIMDQSRSKRQVLILDCCNSGAFAQGTKAAAGVSIGTATAFESGYGRIILTASDATQFAWEGDRVIGETDNSLFTHFLVTGLEGEADRDGDGCITVDEVYDYAYERVKIATPKQTPSKFSSKQQGEIILRQITRIQDIRPLPLPEELISEIEDIRPYVREAAVQKLEKIVKGRNIGLARSAMEALEKIVADDNTTRRVAQAALHVLESVKQAQDSANQKTEEEQRIRGGTERLAALETKEKQLERERAETKRKADQEIARREATHLRIERERAEKAFQKKEKQKAAEAKAAQLKREREVAMQASRENVEYQFEQIKARLHQSSENSKEKWQTFVTYIKAVPVSRYRIHIALGMVIPLIAALSLWQYQKLNSPTFVFSSNVAGETNVYFYDDNTTGRLTSSAEKVRNWSPTVSASGKLYFTSNRTGKAEIYYMKDNGEALQLTDTPGTGQSWSPAVSAFGKLYFTSNRTGKAEIYYMQDDGEALQLTDTPGTGQSWSPAVNALGKLYFTSDRTGKAEIYYMKNDGDALQLTDTPGTGQSWSPTVSASGKLYFTSNRTGKAEIYYMKDNGEALQLTDTPGTGQSWSPAVNALGKLYFTSDRTGKAEIYYMKNDGEALQITYTPGLAQSWSPVIRGSSIYFTSNRQGHNAVYVLNDGQPEKISSDNSWTTTLTSRYPSSVGP